MDLNYTEKEKYLRKEIRKFLASESELIKKARKDIQTGQWISPQTKEFIRKIGAKGWLTITWPVEYGGLGGSYIDRYIVYEELSYAGAPANPVGVSMVGPTILLFGNEGQKKLYLPAISRGEVEFALGYTEPNAGSDLASLETHAVREGDHYIINGQKVFSSGCELSDYHWLAAKTNTEGPPHRGLSLFIVDLKSPGITIRPMIGMSGIRVNEVFYDDVSIPVDNLVGEENRGWQYMMTALSFERTWLVGDDSRRLEELWLFTKETKRLRGSLSADPAIRQRLAQLATELEITRLMGLKVADMLNKGTTPTYEAAMAKAFGSEVRHRLAECWLELLSSYGQLSAESGYAYLTEGVEQWYLDTVRTLITRGTNEIMRNIIALIGLGLPRN